MLLALSSLGFDALSGRELAALAPLFLLLLALIGYCLADLVRAPSVRYLPKIVWALVILFVSAPVGPILYLALGKDRSGRDLQLAAKDVEPRPHEWV